MIKIKKKRKKFSILQGNTSLAKELTDFPLEDECFKFVSKQKFSSISFISWIAERTVINEMYVSSFRIGKKEIILLNRYFNEGKIVNAMFLICDLMKFSNDEKTKYNYFSMLQKVCNKNNWKIDGRKNHSKIMLFYTTDGTFVLETSSNLNENPSIEYFSFERDEDLANFYKKELFENGSSSS